MDIQIKVTPQSLKDKAQTVEAEIKKIEDQWKRIQDIISRSKSYWQGDASNAHQRYFREVSQDVSKMIRRMKEHPKDLMVMAGVYEGAERSSKGTANALPDNVID